MFVIYDKEKQRVPVKIWQDADNVEDSAIQQLINVSSLPFVRSHIAAMPDVHTGYGVPIGCVFATQGYVVPNAVGVDIGCGMRFMKTNIDAQALRENKMGESICGDIRREIPLGKYHRDTPKISPKLMDKYQSGSFERPDNLQEEYRTCFHSLGTLGGGNHFIELQENQDGKMCVMLHSGSRHLGYAIAEYYNNIAKDKNGLWLSKSQKDLDFLPIKHKDGQNYLGWMGLALTFAKENRRIMMEHIQEKLRAAFKQIEFSGEIDVHHNYATMEHHNNKNVMVHRKGAIRARKGDTGIIPGAMGDYSYVVDCKGCEYTFDSASHGAGRCMSRTQAKEEFTVEEMMLDLKENDVVLSTPNNSDVLDEYKKAYKPIEDVIGRQSGVVEPVHKLKTVCVIKG